MIKKVDTFGERIKEESNAHSFRLDNQLIKFVCA